MRTLPHMNKNIYHEKQFRNYCRCHAINNLYGRQIVTVGEFDKYCDAFDISHKISKGVSRRNYYFINNGGIDNIFGYILGAKGEKIGMHHYDYFKKKDIHLHPKSIGMIVYSQSHTFCVRMIDGVLYKIDSLSRSIQKVSVKMFERVGLGVIDVFRL